MSMTPERKLLIETMTRAIAVHSSSFAAARAALCAIEDELHVTVCPNEVTALMVEPAWKMIPVFMKWSEVESVIAGAIAASPYRRKE